MLAEFAGDAHHAVKSAGVVDAARRLTLARMPVINHEGTQSPVSGFSRHARAELRVGNLPGEKQAHWGLKEARVLDKERALFREQNCEALVYGDLRVVGLHLTEIGIQRDVEGESVLGDELRVQPRPVFESVLIRRRRPRRSQSRLIQKVVTGE